MEILSPMECSSQTALHSKHRIHPVTDRPYNLAEDRRKNYFIIQAGAIRYCFHSIESGKLQQHCKKLRSNSLMHLIVLDPVRIGLMVIEVGQKNI